MDETLIDTDKLYGIKDGNIDIGEYSETRKIMDYNYYSRYSPERVMLQDSIINRLLTPKKQSKNKPYIIYTCGPMGAGKSHTIKELITDDHLYIDPDMIKSLLPECKQFTEQYPDKASTLLHKESVFISLMLEYKALKSNINIIVDGTLRDYSWYTDHIQELRNKHPNYIIGIYKVEASLNLVKERCVKRAKITGRIIPMEFIETVYNMIDNSFNILKHKVDFYKIIDNNVNPKIIYEYN